MIGICEKLAGFAGKRLLGLLVLRTVAEWDQHHQTKRA
jgi:hypothetical protein